MSEFWQQLLIQVAISFLSGLLGGGLISTYLDWRRFRQEQAEIKKEEQRVAVDPIRSMISVIPWKVSDQMNDKLQLYIYKHGLQGSLHEYAIVAEFVIRNLTDEEVIITRIEVEEPGLPPFDYYHPETDDAHLAVWTPDGNPYIQPAGTDLKVYDMQALYDWKTKKEIKIEYVTLKPKETLPVAYVAVRRFSAIRRLATAPRSVIVTVHSTGRHKVTEVLELTEGQLFRRFGRVGKYGPPKYSVEQWIEEERRRKVEEEEKIPF